MFKKSVITAATIARKEVCYVLRAPHLFTNSQNEKKRTVLFPMRNNHPCISLCGNHLISYNEKNLVFLLKSSGVIEYAVNAPIGGLHSDSIQLLFRCNQLFVLHLQFRVADQSSINFPCLLLRGLVVDIPDQIVLGKGLGHRQYYFLSFSFSD